MMLGWTVRLVLAYSSLSPVALLWAIINGINEGCSWKTAVAAALFILPLLLCCCLLVLAGKKLEKLPVRTMTVRSLDHEVNGFLIAYLFPVLESGSLVIMMAWVGLLGFLMSLGNAFMFNPFLVILGYHFYEVKNESGMSRILVSKRVITRPDEIHTIGELSPFVMLDFS